MMMMMMMHKKGAARAGGMSPPLVLMAWTRQAEVQEVLHFQGHLLPGGPVLLLLPPMLCVH